MARRKKSAEKIRNEVLIVIYAMILIMLVIIAWNQLGIVGRILNGLVLVFFGKFPFIVYILVVLISVYLIFKRKLPWFSLKTLVGMVLGLLTVLLYLATPEDVTITGFVVFTDFLKLLSEVFNMEVSANGGLIGAFMFGLISTMVSRSGTFVVLITLVIISAYLLIEPAVLVSIKNKIGVKIPVSKPEEMPMPSTRTMSDAVADQKPKKTIFINSDEVVAVPKSAPKAEHKIIEEVKTSSAATISGITNYSLPSVSLLDEVTIKKGSSANTTASVIKGKRLIEILGQFGINATLVGTHIGPAVTKFEVRPESNVKISKIAAIQDNIKMELQAKDIRIEAPIPGRNAVGVEVPNVEMTPVRLVELLNSIPSDKVNKKLLFILGKDLMGRPVYGELDKMPHLLVAGATGSGKSVCINSIITTLLMRTTPDEVKLLLVDPKKVEFTNFTQIPHLIGPVISDAAEASRALKVIVMMMENRYEVFSKVGVRNITAYNEMVLAKPGEHLALMPWVVVIIDELADLMVVAGKDVEASIQRITQLARAAGIHLIVATQRPSVDVITGIIKSNIPSRIAFAVSSGVDSRTILDHIGAERLLGYGDMLYIPIGEPASIRIQGVFVSDDEVKRVAEAASAQGKPRYDDAFIRLEGVDKNEGFVNANEDPLFEEVKEYVISTQKASTSSLQRRFALGYNRAARMIDALEEQGVIGPSQGSRPRDVYVKKED
jgi:DNA segregation ATPase FtsK/SpoIIIE, S-DNA-T family